jgi:hypothetical protein
MKRRFRPVRAYSCCPICGYYAFDGLECLDCGYRA